jgi:dephospho-CoA kinase
VTSRVRRVGLTGGIGSGKSTVSRLLADHGAYIVDADLLAREVVAIGTPGLAAVAEAFPGVLAADGSLDRPALAERVFGDPEARKRLEAITHPLIRAESTRQMDSLPPGSVCVNDVPLLVEKRLGHAYDLVVVVEAPLDIRLARLVNRGLPEDQALERIASQASDDERRAVADVLLDNGGTLDDLRRQVDQAWPRIAGSA